MRWSINKVINNLCIWSTVTLGNMIWFLVLLDFLGAQDTQCLGRLIALTVHGFGGKLTQIAIMK